MIRVLLLLAFLSPLQSLAMPSELVDILTDIRDDSAAGVHSIVVADLDETLVDTTSRRYESFRQSVAKNCAGNLHGECAAAAGINIAEFLALPNRYDQTALLASLQVSSPLALQLLEDMMANYISPSLIHLDQAVPGAVEFIRRLRIAGAEIYFVSSRSESMQRMETVENLKFLQLLSGPEENLILKPEGMKSIDFKRASFLKIKKLAEAPLITVKLIMENEPENMNAMREAFPGARGIFVDGAMVKAEPLRGHELHLRNFR